MKLLTLLRKMQLRSGFRRKRSATKRPVSRETEGPKNGRLVLALISALLLMVVLVVTNIRLIKDPTIAKKAFGPVLTSCPQPNPKPDNINKPKVPPLPARPDISFYEKLKAEDEAPSSQKIDGTGQKSEQVTPDQNKEKAKSGSKTKSAEEVPTIPDKLPGNQVFTVQVGAFSHPAIAQEWAKKWTTKGYQVTLKPQARPKTGVTYQLYLGKFGTEREADDLIKHLQAKEGITAMRLVYRE